LRFEVSDIAGEKGYAKEKKDLISLGVLGSRDANVSGWRRGRNFLVVSSDFAKRLRARPATGFGWDCSITTR